ncbi:MAG: surfeit locus 1 family protein [Flavobacteriales bacterium]|jgi:surfeit locus 1 family protein
MATAGFWQLSRADEKQTIVDNWSTQQALPAKAIDKSVVANSYQRLWVRGQYDSERYWLLEGQTYRGRLGYQVIMPFTSEDGRWFLVKRGWVAAAMHREELPVLKTPTGLIDITVFARSIELSPLLDERNNPLKAWPHRIVSLDSVFMSEQYGNNFDKALLQLDSADSSAFDIIWQPINMPPEKHIAYAVQWFSMALILALLWLHANSNILACLRKQHITEE